MKKKSTSLLWGSLSIAVGVIVVLVGLLKGGRAGTFFVNDGKVIYANPTKEIVLTNAPDWWKEEWNGRFTVIGFNGWNMYNTRGEANNEYFLQEGNDHRDNAVEIPMNFTADDIRKVDINLPVGNLYITVGEELALSIYGKLECISNLNGSMWVIEGKDTAPGNKEVSDVYITVPPYFNEIEVNLGTGNMNVENVSTRVAEYSVNTGNLWLTGCTAQEELDISVQSGKADVRDTYSRDLSIDSEAGYVDFEGEIDGKVDVDCETGGVNLQLAYVDDYGWEVELGTGYVQMGGQKLVGINRNMQGGNKHALPYFDIAVGTGYVEVAFN